ncbi:MAG TPA: SprT-like domain-containing protein [Acidobacteriota bacterium]|nr:SprT-like domain-containing protein [Acidobacteriota bacterium]
MGGPEFHSARVSFFPYACLTNTIRFREGRYEVRLSDILEEAPPEVLEAVFTVLGSKLLKQPVPPPARQIYRSYVAHPEIRAKVRKVRTTRGRKHLGSPVGKVFDLQHLYDAVNVAYFSGQLDIRHLSWSRRKNRRTLGHYDGAHSAIIINRRLDSRLVPKYVVSYVLFHEMLHAHFGEEYCNGRRRIHHAAFRQAEKGFAEHRKAKRFIERFYGT